MGNKYTIDNIVNFFDKQEKNLTIIIIVVIGLSLYLLLRLIK